MGWKFWGEKSEASTDRDRIAQNIREAPEIMENISQLRFFNDGGFLPSHDGDFLYEATM